MARGARNPRAKSTDSLLGENPRPLWLERRTHLVTTKPGEPGVGSARTSTQRSSIFAFGLVVSTCVDQRSTKRSEAGEVVFRTSRRFSLRCDRIRQGDASRFRKAVKWPLHTIAAPASASPFCTFLQSSAMVLSRSEGNLHQEADADSGIHSSLRRHASRRCARYIR